MSIRPLDREALRASFRSARPFPHVKIEGFLDDAFAREVVEAYPTFEQARGMGRLFEAVNEHGKIQICDASLFAPPIARLNEALASPELLETLSYITGIDRLLADAELAGGGIHITGPRGRLDVHVDFNLLPERQLHRRLNLLLYLNPVWEREWGGAVELWDEKVEVRHEAFAPVMNRCVIFETTDRSYHGVEPVTCPEGFVRRSFATYYYTREAPPGYAGVDHSTVFRARPEERLKKYVLMPAEKARRGLEDARRKARDAKKKLRGLLGKE